MPIDILKRLDGESLLANALQYAAVGGRFEQLTEQPFVLPEEIKNVARVFELVDLHARYTTHLDALAFQRRAGADVGPAVLLAARKRRAAILAGRVALLSIDNDPNTDNVLPDPVALLARPTLNNVDGRVAHASRLAAENAFLQIKDEDLSRRVSEVCGDEGILDSVRAEQAAELRAKIASADEELSALRGAPGYEALIAQFWCTAFFWFNAIEPTDHCGRLLKSKASIAALKEAGFAYCRKTDGLFMPTTQPRLKMLTDAFS